MERAQHWRLKRKVIQHYDALSKVYNALYGYEQSLKIEEALKFVNINLSDVVLDVGCGTGILFKHIFNSAGLIVGIDISSQTLNVAKKTLRGIGLDKISLIRADADFLPFKDRIFDKVFAITLLQNMPNPTLTVNEIMRVAKDDAEIVLTGLKKFFSKESFLKILEESGMSFHLLNTGDNIKCHIAICGKRESWVKI
ncbi:methyltransferase domain-containing protein [Candidatus Bathyarchaeota archaeon]|nr:methyltransferase domain-containing protein [Candidatus Bathyarchaeota archaeon]